MIKKKRVAALCKACKRLQMQTMPDKTQWIGNGTAMYILAGIEPMSAESLASMLDYTEKDYLKISFVEGKIPVEVFSDENSTDVQIEAPPKRVIIRNSEYLIFETAEKLIFIDGDYLKPIVTDGQTTFFMRKLPESNYNLLCVKKGFFPEAIIAGVEFSEKSLYEWFDDMACIITSIQDKYLLHLEKEAESDEQLMLEGKQSL